MARRAVISSSRMTAARISPKVEIEEDGLDMFVIVNGVTIARRGHAGTPEAGTWVSLPVDRHGQRGDNRIEIRIVCHGKPVLH
jgi:hypothetical protein